MTGQMAEPGDWEISPAGTQEALKSPQAPTLIDCREEDEFAFCRIEGALLAPLSNFRREIEGLALGETELIVYCHHGIRSLRAVALLREMGYEASRSMLGGIDQWSREIDPTIPTY